MELKDFQKIAIDQISNTFLDLWKTEKYRLPLVFKAPTGAGKTVMMAEFLRCLDDNFQFHEDKAYIWVSFGGDESYMQSKNKLYQYFNEGTDMSLKDVNNLSEGKLYKNNIFFINWSKIKGTDKESKKLRKSGGVGYGGDAIFDEFIGRTRKERDIILIIDEAHTETETHLANEVIDLIDPRIIIKVTATPKDLPNISDVSQKKAGFVEVLESDVISSGLIKEKIIIQTDEDIRKLGSKHFSEDEIMLELAYNKRLELKKYYNELGLNINPLVLIQLPSDFKEKEEVQANLKDLVLSFLKQKGVKDNEIAIWLSNEKTNLELIEKNNNKIDFMIFKVAPATGWDCPRADILVMFREIMSPTFHTQIIGRIKRMPEGHHYEKEELNKAYIYTNYNKSHIRDVKEAENQNKPPIFYTKLKNNIERISLETVYHQRTDFNTLTPPPLWQKFFLQSSQRILKKQKLILILAQLL
jgi:type III restriction enzyme